MRPDPLDLRLPRRGRPTQGTSARGRRGEIRLKRAYERPADSDGVRVLVDRLWPRGLSKDEVAADLWLKEVAPSEQLRRWFGHDPRRWERFRAKYRAELAGLPDILALLDGLRHRGPVTLVYGARDEAHNQAVVLREALEDEDFASRRPRRPPQPAQPKAGRRKGASQ